MRKYSIWLFGDSWDEQYRRRQRLAIELARMPFAESVFFVEPPLTFVSLVKWALGRADADAAVRWKSVFKSGFERKTDGVTVVTPFVLFSSAIFLRRLVMIAVLVNLRVLGMVEGDDVMLVVTLPNWTPFWFRRVRHGVAIYDCSEAFDRQGDNLRLSGRSLGAVRGWDDELTSRADIVLVNSPALHDDRSRLNRNTLLFPNSIDKATMDAFLSVSDAPRAITSAKGPVLGYVGHINELVDVDLLCLLAKAHREWTIVVIGSCERSEDSAKLGRYENIRLLGKVPFTDLPGYVAGFSVCLGLYRDIPLNATNIGLKYPLYIVSGRPVISTPTGGAEYFREFVEMAEDGPRFIGALERVLGEGSSAKRPGADEMYKFTWDCRMREFEDAIRALGKE